MSFFIPVCMWLSISSASVDLKVIADDDKMLVWLNFLKSLDCNWYFACVPQLNDSGCFGRCSCLQKSSVWSCNLSCDYHNIVVMKCRSTFPWLYCIALRSMYVTLIGLENYSEGMCLCYLLVSTWAYLICMPSGLSLMYRIAGFIMS